MVKDTAMVMDTVTAVMVIVVAVTATVTAMDMVRRKPAYDISTLSITANYSISRIRMRITIIRTMMYSRLIGHAELRKDGNIHR